MAWVGGIKTFTMFCSRDLLMLSSTKSHLLISQQNGFTFPPHHLCTIHVSVYWAVVEKKACFVLHLLSSHEPRLVNSPKNGLKLLIHHLHNILLGVYWLVFWKCYPFWQNMPLMSDDCTFVIKNTYKLAKKIKKTNLIAHLNIYKVRIYQFLDICDSKAPFTYGPVQASQAWHRAWLGAWPRYAPVYTIGAGTAPTRSSIWPPSICVMSCVCWSLFFNFDDVTELVCNNYENSNLKKLFDVALFVNSRRHNSADQLSPHCVVIIAFLYYKSVWRSKIAMA